MVVVIYGSVKDEEASRIIADAFRYVLSLTLPEVADPLTQFVNEDIICVGGTCQNVFYRYYFAGNEVSPERLWDSLLNPANFPDNPELWKLSQRYNFGVSPDGKRHIQTIVRENGTKVTGIAGVHKADTLEASEQYILPAMPVLGVALPLAGATPALVALASRGVK